MKTEFSRQIFEKYTDIKLHENPFSGSRIVPCGQTDRQTDMTKIIVAFSNFTKAPVKSIILQRVKKSVTYRGADKSLVRPGRKQATATESFDFHISYL
jgi:hypothetical protein